MRKALKAVGWIIKKILWLVPRVLVFLVGVSLGVAAMNKLGE